MMMTTMMTMIIITMFASPVLCDLPNPPPPGCSIHGDTQPVKTHMADATLGCGRQTVTSRANPDMACATLGCGRKTVSSRAKYDDDDDDNDHDNDVCFASLVQSAESSTPRLFHTRRHSACQDTHG